MRSLFQSFVVLCLSACLVACGGSSGGGNNMLTTTPPTPVTLTVSGATPMLAATQIAGGSWSALTMSGATATFNVPSSSAAYAVAVLCPARTSGVQIEAVLEALASDTTSPTLYCPPTTSVTMTVNFDLSAVPGAVDAAVAVGTDISAYWPGPTSAANVQNVVTGTQDIGVAAYGPTPTTAPYGVQIQRGVDVTGAPITVPAMSTSDETGSATITVNGVPSGYSNSVSAYYVTAGGATIPINGTSVPNYALIAAGDTQSGDFYSVQSAAVDGTGTNIVEQAQSFASGANLTLTLPAPMSYSGPTPAQYPTFDATYSGFTGSGKTGWIAALDWPSTAPTVGILVYATSGFLGSNSIAIPDLSSVSGFIAPPASGTQVAWSVVAFQQSALYFAFDVFATPSSETAQYAIEGGEYTEP